MCAAGHDPHTFEFVARMGRLTIGTDDENESRNRAPLSFIMPVLPPRQEKLGRNQRACKSVDLSGDAQYDEDTHKRFQRQSSEESLRRICQSRKKAFHDHARKGRAVNSPTSSQCTSNGASAHSSPTPPE